MRVDESTLPDGLELKVLDNRQAAQANSRFVDMIAGDMHRADFAAACPTENVEDVMAELSLRNQSIDSTWAIDAAATAHRNNFNEQTIIERSASTNMSGDLGRGVISGPSQSGGVLNESLASNSQTSSFIGWSLQLVSFSTETAANTYLNNLIEDIQRQSFIYKAGKYFTVRYGFGGNKSELVLDATALKNKGFETNNVKTTYNKIPEQVRLNFGQKLTEQAPDLTQGKVKLTKKMGKEGTWLWPKNNMSTDGRFTVAVLNGVNPQLFVNDEPVPYEQVGEHIKNTAAKTQVLAWYGIEMPIGSNLVQVKAQDMFGNMRVLAEKTFIVPDRASHIKLVAEEEFLEADGGMSVMPILVRALDDKGNLARGTYFVTLETDGHESFIEDDVQPEIAGLQVRVVDGERRVHLRSTNATGNIEVRAINGVMTNHISVYQSAPKTPLIVVGMLGIDGRYGKFSGDNAPSSHESGIEDNKFTHDTQAAVFMKGQIVGGLNLTLSYDKNKKDAELLREVTPGEYYELPGDASVRGYDARSRSKLYARVEKERSYAMWGDYSTATNGVGQNNVGRVNRILTGFDSAYDNGDLKVRVFAAETEDKNIVEEIRGNGTALFHQLGFTDIVRNSDLVEIIARDRDNPSIEVSRVKLERYVDYYVDYISGNISFNQVIPSVDENLNPIFIRISFDVEGSGKETIVAGTQASYIVNQDLAVGASYIQDQHEDEGAKLSSVWLEYQADDTTLIEASVAYMDNKLDSNGNGAAYRTRIQKDWDGGAATSVQYARGEQGFRNTSGGVAEQTEDLRLNHRQPVGAGYSVDIEGNGSRNLENDDTREAIAATLDGQIFDTSWRFRAGGRYVHQKYAETDDEFTTAIIGTGTAFEWFERQGRFDIEYEHSLGAESRQRGLVGIDYQIFENTSLYGRYELIDSLNGILDLGNGKTQTFSFGARIDWLENFNSYSEFRQRGATNGQNLEMVNGFRSRHEITPGLSIDPSVEWIDVVNGDGEGGLSVSVGVADIRDENSKMTGRVEYRNADTSDYYGLSGVWVKRLNIDWSALVRDDVRFNQYSSDQEDTWKNSLNIGVAYRPRLTNDYDFLLNYEWIAEQDETDRHAHLFTTHHNLRLNEDWMLSGRLGLKYEDLVIEDVELDNLSSVLGVRALWYIDRRWDLDIHGGVLATDSFKGYRHNLGLGVNYLAAKGLRVGVGYNFYGFKEEDLDPEGYYAEGAYIMLNYKFDESWFNWLKY
ncbi:SPOR domain-containing protein [Shewanella marina]|uniref:SPOR domain-containing protein n=1 Tax=Shewanella marina TaxID=487319 RepID=UPI0006881957|nr:SPOR domain-containing protein [Shewanella marina]